MAEHIEREAFLAEKRHLYCENCARRKGMKNGKFKVLYEIGGAPCRACGINDVLEDVEDYPAADVVPVRHGRWVVKGQDIYCSECNAESAYNPFGASKFSIYCHNCGARMDKKETL